MSPAPRGHGVAWHGQELLVTAGLEVWAALLLDVCLGRAPGTISFPKAPSLPALQGSPGLLQTGHFGEPLGVELGSDSFSLSQMDLASQYIKAAVKNIPSVFLMTDSQVAEESFLVVINDFLASGEVPGLFQDTDLETIMGSMRPQVKSLGMEDTKENCWKLFIEKVRRQLKVGVFSPGCLDLPLICLIQNLFATGHRAQRCHPRMVGLGKRCFQRLPGASSPRG